MSKRLKSVADYLRVKERKLQRENLRQRELRIADLKRQLRLMNKEKLREWKRKHPNQRKFIQEMEDWSNKVNGNDWWALGNNE
jgi:hypothetical protein